MLRIGAVVVTYNRKDLLCECLESLINQSYKLSRIIVIDNNSTDGTEDILKENYFSYIDYYKLDKNIGGAGGFYEGIKKSIDMNLDWLWIMDDDTIPKANALEALVLSISQVNKYETFSFLASAVYGENGEFMNVPQINLAKSDNGYEYWYKYLSKGMVQIQNATFVSLLIRFDAIQKCGLPVKDYFIWGDDYEYTMRLITYYGPAYFVGNSEVVHKRKNAKTLSIVDDDSDRLNFYFYMYRNGLINTRAYFGKKAVIGKLYSNLKTIIKILLKRSSKRKMQKINLILKGSIAYLLGKYNKEAFQNRFSIEK